MALRRTRRRGSALPTGLPMAPMIDIVFQLMAFFIMALSMEPVRVNAGITPPAWGNGGQEPQAEEIVLELDRDGQLLNERGQPIDLGAFGAALKKQLGEEPQNTRIVLRADEATRYENIEKIVALLRLSGVEQIGLRLRRPETP